MHIVIKNNKYMNIGSIFIETESHILFINFMIAIIINCG